MIGVAGIARDAYTSFSMGRMLWQLNSLNTKRSSVSHSVTSSWLIDTKSFRMSGTPMKSNISTLMCSQRMFWLCWVVIMKVNIPSEMSSLKSKK